VESFGKYSGTEFRLEGGLRLSQDEGLYETEEGYDRGEE